MALTKDDLQALSTMTDVKFNILIDTKSDPMIDENLMKSLTPSWIKNSMRN